MVESQKHNRCIIEAGSGMISHSKTDAKVAELVGLIELKYWQSNNELHQDCKNLLDLCLKEKNEMLGYAYLLYGRSFLIVGDFASALSFIHQAELWCKKKNDKAHLPLVLLWLGVTNKKIRNYNGAFKAWLEALKIALENSKLEIAIEVYLNIGMLYQLAELHEECSGMLMSGFTIAESINDKKLLAKSCIFLSDALIFAGQYSAAMSIVMRAEMDIILHGDMTWIIESCKNKGACLWYLGQKDEAITCFESGLAIASEFNLNWAYAATAVIYAEMLLLENDGVRAQEILLNARHHLDLFPDDDLTEKWFFLQYRTMKLASKFELALAAIKKAHACRLHNIEKSVGYGLSGLFLQKLRKLYPSLRRDFIKFERLAGGSNIRMSMKQLMAFKALCDHSVGSGRIIEINVKPESRSIVDQRALLVITDYCSPKDVWIKVGNGRFYIYPTQNGKSLHDFSMRLVKAIEAQPWSRFQLSHVIARARILMVEQMLIDQVDQIIQRGWHDAG
ncbi:hypothetical protein HQ393_16810 [Chitinibacter bivalviorum]|uniref:Tetratricopeptide repeat protein n=1 Tax=Chitinibacter bivalviorum TaxID=2739434 RepID=A0A7H9BMS0_9NEIS|nr:hypothetical protein [Chitinibacter bivalviorum]QLG89769.1 hypothetical protein HQ393_16810 [Chitinibacter bivalviorum]